MSEIHGMAQRGGSVFSEIRIGDILSPIFEDGEGDFLISLEPSEVLRYIHKVKKDSIILINDYKIIPFTVSLGISSYPDKEKIYESLKDITEKFYVVNGTEILEEKKYCLYIKLFHVWCFFLFKHSKFQFGKFL